MHKTFKEAATSDAGKELVNRADALQKQSAAEQELAVKRWRREMGRCRRGVIYRL